MAKNNELNVDVNVCLSVPDEVAERIMTLLAMYLDDHPNKALLMERDENGKHHGKIDDLTAPERGDALVIAHASDIPCHTERIWLETREDALFPVEYKRWDDTDFIYFYDRYKPYNEFGWRADTYNCDWRCWTKKPSEEQRETVEWNEKADDTEPFPEWRAHVERFMAAEPEAKADDPAPFPEWDVIPVQEIPSYTGQIIFLEDYSPGQVIGVKYRYADEKEETMVFRVVPRNRSETDGLTLYRRIEDYGRLWRCWNRPTTTEERKAVKWL